MGELRMNNETKNKGATFQGAFDDFFHKYQLYRKETPRQLTIRKTHTVTAILLDRETICQTIR
jgi:hypothetical protein